MNDKKISEIGVLVLPLEQIQALTANLLLVPAVLSGNTGWTNYALDLGSIIRSMLDGCILEKVNEAIANYSLGNISSGSGNTSSGGASLTDLDNLTMRVSTLESFSIWPTHSIKITDNSTGLSNTYNLSTAPHSSGQQINIITSSIENPNFYVIFGNNTPTITSSSISTNIYVLIYSKYLGVTYKGGYIRNIKIMGGYRTTNGSYYDFPLLERSFGSNNRLEGGLENPLEYSFTLSRLLGTESPSSIEVRLLLNNIDLGQVLTVQTTDTASTSGTISDPNANTQ